jgi:murein DD-endopeptidase MepM/ murein hydrolase activator NlpD
MPPVLRRLLSVTLLFALALWATAPAEPAHMASAQAQPSRPFRLPFAEPPGPSTWLVIQMYGNTTGAYAQRDTTYRAGQGLHFGIDFSAPCGTPVVAIGDGVVFAVDGPFGSPPHNVMIHHANGYSSLYGHLRERSALRVGQQVRAGDVIGLSGDSYFTCRSAPHLHLEIRNLAHNVTYNPVQLIEADWDALLLFGTGGASFQRDLDQPRRWQRIDDQPDASFGGPLLNNYARPWPRDYRR